jgi:hypothetical protein
LAEEFTVNPCHPLNVGLGKFADGGNRNMLHNILSNLTLLVGAVRTPGCVGSAPKDAPGKVQLAVDERE